MFNGVYRPVSEHRGWPVLQNGDGMYCYYRLTSSSWHLHKDHDTLDKTGCRSYISFLNLDQTDGMLPPGTRKWTGPIGNHYGHFDRDDKDHWLTFTVLVRSSYGFALCSHSLLRNDWNDFCPL
jgi:hypothetical protein